MLDRNGEKVSVGDKVDVECIVKGMHNSDDGCELTLETVYGRKSDGLKEGGFKIDSACLEVIERVA